MEKVFETPEHKRSPKFESEHFVDFVPELRAYQKAVESSEVFEKILESIRSGWKDIGKKDRLRILKLIDGVIAALESYQDRYKNVERIADKRFQLHFDDPEKGLRLLENSDRSRKVAHDALVDSLNILSRTMKEVELDNSWRANDHIYSPSPHGMREKISEWALETNIAKEDNV